MDTPSEQAPDPLKRIPQLDGVRGLAILLVLIWHYYAPVWSPNSGPAQAFLKKLLSLSWSGVDLFFVLSGFLIGGILLNARGKSRYYANFYTKRVFRIVPAYAALLLSFAVFQRIDWQDAGSLAYFTDTTIPIWSYLVFVQNIYMSVLDVWGAEWLAVSWSLAIEEQFYLIAPFMISYFSRRSLPRVLVVLILVAPVFRTIALTSWGDLAPFVMLPARMDALLLGVLGAWMVRQPTIDKALRDNTRFLYGLLLVMLSGIVVFSLSGFDYISPALTPMGYSWIAVCYLVMILVAVYSPSRLIRRFFTFKPLMGLGTISYFVYLFHMIFHALSFHFITGKQPLLADSGDVVATLVALLATIIFGALSWRLFEGPLIRYGRRKFVRQAA